MTKWPVQSITRVHGECFSVLKEPNLSETSERIGVEDELNILNLKWLENMKILLCVCACAHVCVCAHVCMCNVVIEYIV
jgi:hypothetical protein